MALTQAHRDSNTDTDPHADTGIGAFADTLPLTDIIEDYLLETRTLAPKTHRWYTYQLGIFQRWACSQDITTMAQVSARDIRRFLDAQEQVINSRTGTRLAAQTRHGTTQVLKQWLRWAGREGYCERHLYDRVKMPKREQRVFKTLAKEHIAALFAASAREVHPTLVARDRALLAVLLSTGIRAAEACSLTSDNLHLEDVNDPYVVVRGKGNKWREVGLAQSAVRYLRRYVRLRASYAQVGVGTLFIGQKGQPMTPSGINQMLSRLARWAGMDDVPVSAHQTRRAFAVHYMSQDGADIFKLRELMGHSDIQTTLIYLRDFKQKDARRGPNPLDKLL